VFADRRLVNQAVVRLASRLITENGTRHSHPNSDLHYSVGFIVLVINGVKIRIVPTDAVSFETDVLALKHAQALHGLDERVVEIVGLDPQTLPYPDSFQVINQPLGVAAHALLFIGVKPIREFSYPDIRRFARTVLSASASEVPDAMDIALTLHGAGYGLDEIECFDAEIGGIFDGLDAHDHPKALHTISILESDTNRARRLTERLGFLTGDAEASSDDAQVDRLQAAGGDVTRQHAFVAMPFDESFSDVFHYGISRAVRANGFLCERIDKQTFTGDILKRLKEQIRSATFVVADLTGANANVSLEVGYAWGTEVPTILVRKDGEPSKFDVQSQRTLLYRSIKELEEMLHGEIKGLLPEFQARIQLNTPSS
jgi:hypothetical protein